MGVSRGWAFAIVVAASIAVPGGALGQGVSEERLRTAIDDGADGIGQSVAGGSPLTGPAGTLGGLLTTWVTFTPCFLWIFFGAPFVEALRGNKALSSALGAITAAVVGVILNLAIWFALHVLFARLTPVNGLGMSLSAPVLSSVNLPSLVLTAAAVLAVFRFRVGMMPVLLACSLAGIGYDLLVGLP